MGRKGEVRWLDAADSLVKPLAAGLIDALVVQDPAKMGYLGVKTVVAQIKGERVERRIDTGVRVVSRADMELPEVKELKPDLDRWLKNQ